MPSSDEEELPLLSELSSDDEVPSLFSELSSDDEVPSLFSALSSDDDSLSLLSDPSTELFAVCSLCVEVFISEELVSLSPHDIKVSAQHKQVIRIHIFLIFI